MVNDIDLCQNPKHAQPRCKGLSFLVILGMLTLVLAAEAENVEKP